MGTQNTEMNSIELGNQSWLAGPAGGVKAGAVGFHVADYSLSP